MSNETATKPRTPILSYWESEGAQEIVDALGLRQDGNTNGARIRELARAEIRSQFDACDEIDEYTLHDVDWTYAGVARKLYDDGVLARRDAREALDLVNWDTSVLDEEVAS